MQVINHAEFGLVETSPARSTPAEEDMVSPDGQGRLEERPYFNRTIRMIAAI